MCIILHCRVLLPCTFSCTPLCIPFSLLPSLPPSTPLFGGHFMFVQPSLAHPDVMLDWLTAEPMWRTDNKIYQHNHEQPEFGTQCGAYSQWTGAHTHRCNTQLLGDIASHPQLRQHHELAHVGQPAANSRSHTKNNFFPWKNTCKCMTFTVRLTGQHQAVHNTITYQ